MKNKLYESIDKNWERFSDGKRILKEEANFAKVSAEIKSLEVEAKEGAKLVKEMPEFKQMIAALKKVQKPAHHVDI